jgi:hypothetical protein
MAKSNTNILTIVIAIAIFIICASFAYQCVGIYFKGRETFDDNIKNVKLYRLCNKSGTYDDIEGGRYAQFNMTSTVVGDKELSGIDIPDNTKVTLFSEQSFTGDSKSLTSSVDCLTSHDGWNKRTRSMIIQPLVTVYPECNFLGVSKAYDEGIFFIEWGSYIKSIKIPSHYSVILMDTQGETPNTIKREIVGPIDIRCLDDIPYGTTDSWSVKARMIKIVKVAELFSDPSITERMLTIPIEYNKVHEVPSNFKSIRVPPRLKALVYYNKDVANKDNKGEQASYVFLNTKTNINILRPKQVPTNVKFNVFIKFVLANIGKTAADVDAEMAKWKW